MKLTLCLMSFLLLASSMVIHAKVKRLDVGERERCPVVNGGKIGIHDYRDRSEYTLKLKGLVEGAHFSKSVRLGVAGNTGSLMGDLDYVLRKFPNHPQALMVAIRHQESPDFSPQKRKDRRDYLWPDIQCYLDRALTFAPDDPAMHHLVAVYSHQRKKIDVALKHYQEAVKLSPSYAEAHYNLGLLYTQLEQYDNAAKHAAIAYKLGYQLPGLRKKLALQGIKLDQERPN